MIKCYREDKLDVLERRCVESGLKTSDIWWYADLRRYGSVPHAGNINTNTMIHLNASWVSYTLENVFTY